MSRAPAGVPEPMIAPSILSADFARLGEEAEAVRNADWLHVDVMDAHFVPNLTIGLPVVQSLRKATILPLDCHLMIDDPERWAPGYAEAGAANVTFHAEATRDPVSLARTIRAAGSLAGLSIKPGTSLDSYLEMLHEFDTLLVMTVEPGFGGRSSWLRCCRRCDRLGPMWRPVICGCSWRWTVASPRTRSSRPLRPGPTCS